ncbi:MAG: patatin-like phospholipase family protein [Bacteroidota bacterium]|nr:patatin-like phospholipase family protein [Bacteroidota bacterium]
MKKIFFVYGLIACFSSVLQAQKVGLVLSGGGAKGITHIGIIKALEENNIPIDYVAGTSMGAIVGGMYAMGFSPEEMIETLKSKEFKYWSTGEIESNYKYYYRNADPKPNFVEISFDIHNIDSINLKSAVLPTNLVSPHQMNYAFVPLSSQANAVAGGDFDKLFIPFRCVASDIYNKEAVVFRYGVLGDAIRASLSYPFMFKPVVIDHRLLFDGGIFNNFPVDVMRSDFKPEFMIGSVVANNPRKPGERDIVIQIENMIMNRTDYSLPKKEGVLLKFNLPNFKLFDFSRVDELVQIGYDSTMKHMKEIKARVKRRVLVQKINEKRKTFKNRYPELKFQHVEVEGVDSLQKIYIQQVFHNSNDVFTLKDFKEAYFKLISDDKILEVTPHAVYNSSTGNFDLHLNVKTQNHLKVLLGGNVSSSTSNQAYFGLSYQNLTDYAQSAYVDAQFGKVYNGLGIGTRIEIPAQKSWYAKIGLVLHKFDYFEGDELFYYDNRTANFTQNEIYSKLSAGFPLTMKGRLEFGVGYGFLTDNYYLNKATITSTTKEDKSLFSLGSLFSRIESYTLNDVMYPTKGYSHSTSLQLIGGEQTFRSGNDPTKNVNDLFDTWIQWRAKYEQYIPVLPKVTLGMYGELALSSRKLLQNYTVSVIEAPAFHPTPYSKTVFNESYCANQYAAIGLKPIYQLTNDLHVRGEAYWFVPYKTIDRAADNSAYYSSPFHSTQFMAETSLVYNFKIASAGMFMNYYSSAASKWNFGINIGFLLFNPKFTE